MYAEACRLLPRWEVLERTDELRHQSLHRHDEECVAEHPVVIGVRGDLGALIWVHPQIEHGGRAQTGERIAPDCRCPFGPLLAENEFPVISPYRHQLTVVI